MKCPHCGHDLVLDGFTEDPEHRNAAMACRACNLAGPRRVLERLAARLAPAETREAAYRMMLELRDVEVPCKGCNGSGRMAYGSTSTWRGGIGGQAMTGDVCCKCWGTGDANRKGADLRRATFKQAKETP